MRALKGPGLFLAQYINQQAPFNSLASFSKWVAEMSFTSIQIPCSSDPTLFNLTKAAESRAYCDDVRGILAEAGIGISSLSTQFNGRLAAIGADSVQAANSIPSAVVCKGEPGHHADLEHRLLLAAKASQNLGLNAHILAPDASMFAQRLSHPLFAVPPQLTDQDFSSLGNQWLHILSAFDEAGIDLCFDLHPGGDLRDGATIEQFVDATNHHPRLRILFNPAFLFMQQIDYLEFLDHYHALIAAFHAQDAEICVPGYCGFVGNYDSWIGRPVRFRRLGDGQINLGRIVSRLAKYNWTGAIILKLQDRFDNVEESVRQGSALIRRYISQAAESDCGDFGPTNTLLPNDIQIDTSASR